MRILLAHHLPLEGSASGRATRDLAVGLRELGHTVECLAVDRRRGPQPDDPAPVERVQCRPGDAQADLPLEMPWLARHAEGRIVFSELDDAQLEAYRDALRRRLDACIDRFDPHLIHCQHAWLLGHLALESGAPYVITYRGPELDLARDDPRLERLIEQAVENAGRLLVRGKVERERLLESFPDAADRVEMAPVAVDLRLYQPGLPSRASIRAALRLPDDGRPVVVFVGDLEPECGVETLLNAVAAVEARGQRLTAVLCGEGSQRPTLEAQAKLQRLNHAQFVGEISRRDRATLMNLADVVVLPGRVSFCLEEAVEALASGTPVIAAKGGAAAGAIDRCVGGLVDAGDHELLAEMLWRALDENWKSSKGPAARRTALREHALATAAARHVAIYQLALEQRFGSPDPK